MVFLPFFCWYLGERPPKIGHLKVLGPGSKQAMLNVVQTHLRSRGMSQEISEALCGYGSIPCTPVVHIKIAGIYGCE